MLCGLVNKKLHLVVGPFELAKATISFKLQT